MLVELFDPTTDQAQEAPGWPPLATPPARRPQDGPQTYGAAPLAWSLPHGLACLDLEQLRLVDAAAQRAVCDLPADLDVDARRLDRWLHEHRTAVQRAIARRLEEARAREAQLAALLATAPPQDPDAPDQDGPDPGDDQARAIRLLRAAPALVMQPPDRPDGGRLARLTPPSPTQPPQAGARRF